MSFIVYDEWLSKIIGKKAYNLQNSFNVISKEYFPKDEIFIWTKIPILETDKLINLQKLGFYIVDTNVQLSSKNFNHKYINNDVRFAKPEDEKSVKDIAKNSFELSRFHLDNQITQNTACKIKEEWAGNYFAGKRGKWMIVAEYKSTIVGFLQLLEKNNNTIVIDLVAVKKEHRGKGLAKNMIFFAYLNCLNNITKVEVGTQISNISSLNMYTKLGFFINSSSYVLHMHQKNQN